MRTTSLELDEISVLTGDEYEDFVKLLSKKISKEIKSSKEINEALTTKASSNINLYALNEGDIVTIQVKPQDALLQADFDLTSHMQDLDFEILHCDFELNENRQALKQSLDALAAKGINLENEVIPRLYYYFESLSLFEINYGLAESLIKFKKQLIQELSEVEEAVAEVIKNINSQFYSDSVLTNLMRHEIDSLLSDKNREKEHYKKVIQFLETAIKLTVEMLLRKNWKTDVLLDSQHADRVYYDLISITKGNRFANIFPRLAKVSLKGDYAKLRDILLSYKCFTRINSLLEIEEKYSNNEIRYKVGNSFLYKFINAATSLLQEKAERIIDRMSNEAYGFNLLIRENADVMDIVEPVVEMETISINELRKFEKTNTFSTVTYFESLCLSVVREYAFHKEIEIKNNLILSSRDMEMAQRYIDTYHLPKLMDIKVKINESISFTQEVKEQILNDILMENILGYNQLSDKNLMNERIALILSIRERLEEMKRSLIEKENAASNLQSKLIKLPLKLSGT